MGIARKLQSAMSSTSLIMYRSVRPAYFIFRRVVRDAFYPIKIVFY